MSCTILKMNVILMVKGGVIYESKKVGHFLKELRNEKKLTQEELAEKLGVSNRSISRWENGVTMPDFDLIIELAKYYDIEIKEILDGERSDSMNRQDEELILKIADYNNNERDSFSKRMSIMFIVAIIGMAVYMIIDIFGLAQTQPYEAIVNMALGFVIGTLLTGFLYTRRYMYKIKAYKMRLFKKMQNIKS